MGGCVEKKPATAPINPDDLSGLFWINISFTSSLFTVFI